MPATSVALWSSSQIRNQSNMANMSDMSECDMDSLSGMLMQLTCDMCDGKEKGENGNILKITRKEKMEMAEIGGLYAIILSERSNEEKELAIKRHLDRAEGYFGDEEEKSGNGNFRDRRGRTPLMYAVAEGDERIIELLLKNDSVDHLARDQSGNTSLMYASARGYDGIVRLLMKEFKRKYYKDSATLLDYLDTENEDGDNAFNLALKKGHEDCAIALSEYLKEALEKEERRVTSLAYRMGLRGKSESRMASSISLKDDPANEPASPEDELGKGDRRRSVSPNKTKRDRKLAKSVNAIRGLGLGRRGRDVSKYYPSEMVGGLLDQEGMGSPEIRRSSPVSEGKVGISVSTDGRCARHHHRQSTSTVKSKAMRQHVSRCRKHGEDRKALCGEEEESGW